MEKGLIKVFCLFTLEILLISNYYLLRRLLINKGIPQTIASITRNIPIKRNDEELNDPFLEYAKISMMAITMKKLHKTIFI